MGDDEVVEALAGDRRPAGVDGAVEAEARAPQHLGARRRRPTTPPRRRRRRRTSAAAGRRATTRSASQRASSARSASSSTPARRPLAAREPLHRDEDREPLHAAHTTGGPRSVTTARSARPRRSLLAVTTSGITGVLGQRWRADVTPWGAVEPWDGSAPLGWHVAADDRWHTPAPRSAPSASDACSARRCSRPGCASRAATPCSGCGRSPTAAGAPSSRSPTTRRCRSPCAFTRPRRADDPAADRRADPGHRPAGGDDRRAADRSPRVGDASALAHDGSGPGPLPPGLPGADGDGARAGSRVAERASRLVLPDARLAEVVVAARCDVLLAGPPDADDGPGRLPARRRRAGADG